MKIFKYFIRGLFRKIGFRLVRIKTVYRRADNKKRPFSKIQAGLDQIVDIEELKGIAETIPGMIRTYSGGFLYSLCYMQSEKGDVIEIGSWQGRSTAFLGWAVKNSGNGRLYAIDHFQGNIGKEQYYVRKKEDLSDLRQGFEFNINELGLSNIVNLLPMSNIKAAQKLGNPEIRFLFIDGDHTKEGVEKDIELFFPFLVDGAIVIFDDFSRAFPGAIQALDALLMENQHSRVMTYANTLVIRYRKGSLRP